MPDPHPNLGDPNLGLILEQSQREAEARAALWDRQRCEKSSTGKHRPAIIASKAPIEHQPLIVTLQCVVCSRRTEKGISLHSLDWPDFLNKEGT